MSNAKSKTPAITRFGTIAKIQVRSSKGQRYAVVTLNCKKFEVEAYAFGPQMVERVIAAGEGAKFFAKVQMQPVQAKNAEGRSYTEERAKIVFFKGEDATAGAATAAEDEVAEGEAAAQDETVAQDADLSAKDHDEEIPF